MDLLKTRYEEIIGFLGVGNAWEILKEGDYSALLTYDGFTAFILPIIPLLVLLEFMLGLVAPGLKNKLLYIVMPPGWSHTGDHKTAKVVREEYLEENPVEAQYSR